MKIIHYIGKEWNSKFIISETECGIYWIDVSDYTGYINLVTCENCLKKLNKNATNK